MIFLKKRPLIVIRGAGDFASAIAHRLYLVGYDVLMLEKARPTAVRREVCFSEAVYQGSKMVERVEGFFAPGWKEAERSLKDGRLTIMVDESGRYLSRFRPHIVVDALKRNVDRQRLASAMYTVGIGGGVCAGDNVDCVVETKRGHDLGRIIRKGRASKPVALLNAEADGMGHYVASSIDGVLVGKRIISSLVKRGDLIAEVLGERGGVMNVYAPLDGVLRGIVHDGCRVSKGMRIAEVDPRMEAGHCFTISDRARCVSGSVLEAIMVFERSLKK